MAVRIESQAEPIPGYRLIERVGGGGFGEVWKAEAPGGLHKAIKFVFGDLRTAGDVNHSSAIGGDDGEGSLRAEQELKALSRVKEVRHPYILSLERFDIIDGQLIIVMELAECNLWDRFKECRTQGLPGIPRDELLIYMEETAEALDLMNNTYQLQHLDIKPQNLFLMFQHVKVADFGLVKDLEGMQASVTGGVTPVYAAPETFDGWVSRFCDQYSLAIVYQELLTGQRPFAGNNVRQLILQHLQAAPNLSPLPPEDQPIIARGLAKVPDQRFPTCRDMVRLLRLNSSPHLIASSSPTPSPMSSPIHVPRPTSIEQLLPAENTSPPTANVRTGRGDSKPGIVLPPPAAQEPPPTPVETPAPPQVPAEINDDGVLFPALVIGLGQLGMLVLQRLRDNLVKGFGSLAQLPQVRLLLLDTDPNIAKTATRGPASSALSVQDIVLTPLNRPSHYLRPRDGRPKIDSWLDPRMLYRIPRSQMTAGVRALGRLAFLDHYRSIHKRLQSELEACLNPNALLLAGRQTGRGIRSNRPRVYIVTSLAGGTGSGMFLDLAYTVRHLLKQIGYDNPEVVGLFLLPPAEGQRTRTLSLGNTYAALTEINFFSSPGNAFAAQYHERKAPVLDPEPPLGRCFVLSMPEEAETVNSREVLELAGQFLCRDLTSPLGKVADQARSQLPAPWQPHGQTCSTFGLYHVAWPRRDLLRTAARQLCQQLVQRWLNRDAKPIAAPVRAWADQQWKHYDLGADQFIARLRKHCETELNQAPEDAFHTVIAPLIRRYAELAKHVGGKKSNAPIPGITADEVETVLAKFEALIGKPPDDGTSEPPKGVVKLLREAGEVLEAKWEQKLMQFPAYMIEQPEYRLAGAEETVRDIVTRIEQILQHQEPLVKDLTKKANDAYKRLRSMLRPPRPGGPAPLLPPEDALELMRSYPKWRYQSLMLQTVTAAFVALRGHLSDELREIDFLRVRLTELGRMLEMPAEAASTWPSLSRCVFPLGCRSLKEATEQFLSAFTPDLLLQLDAKIQENIRRDFTALIHVCLTSNNMLKDVENMMVETAVEFTSSMLTANDVSEILREQYPTTAALDSELASLYAEAAPVLAERPAEVPELFVLATTPGEAGDALLAETHHVLPDAALNPASSPDDILLYREIAHIPLTDLEQTGPAAQEAYRQMAAREHFTPHIRCDIEFEPVAK